MEIKDIYNIETATKYLAMIYLMDDMAIDLVRDILLYIQLAYEDEDHKKALLRKLLKSLELEDNEVDKIASVL